MAAHKEIVLKLENVNKIYSGAKPYQALFDISLEIAKGEYCAVVGPSGSGKSTLLHLLGCLDRPTSGSYKLDGEDVSNLKREDLAKIRNQKLGFIFPVFILSSVR